jgi:hypothetical protein
MDRISYLVQRHKTLVDRISVALGDVPTASLSNFTTSKAKELCELSHPEIKVLIALTDVAKHNYVDLDIKMQELLDITGMKTKQTINTVISKLTNRKILIKNSTPKVVVIDASYYMVGYHQKIIALHEAIKNNEDLREVMKKIENAERAKALETALHKKWKKKKGKNLMDGDVTSMSDNEIQEYQSDIDKLEGTLNS